MAQYILPIASPVHDLRALLTRKYKLDSLSRDHSHTTSSDRPEARLGHTGTGSQIQVSTPQVSLNLDINREFLVCIASIDVRSCGCLIDR